MPWIQINLIVTSQLAESLSNSFMELDARAVTFFDAKDQPIFEPEPGETPIWAHTKVMGLFDASIQPKKIIESLKQRHSETQHLQYKVDQLEDKDWINAWKDQFKPMQFGQNLWIIPTEMTPPNPSGVNLMLDPGMAFGTGTHPTTAMCLTWLDRNTPQNGTVIDYGCGSGVLALAAKKLGAHSVVGVDIDPQAIIASQQNSKRNGLEINFQLAEGFHVDPVDLLVANILSGPLIELAPTFNALIKPNGLILLSGLLTHQTERLIQCYQSLGFKLLEQNDNEQWSSLSLQKTS